MRKKLSYLVVTAMLLAQVPVYGGVSKDITTSPSIQWNMDALKENEPETHNYYVDSTLGDDANTGLSPEQAFKSLDKLNSIIFKPGEKVLFKAGENWSGGFAPKGSGNKQAPIIVDSYTYKNNNLEIGKGEKPVISGEGKVNYTLWLNNVEYWEINNLEITNKGQKPLKGRTGVVVSADDNFDVTQDKFVEHIYLKNLYVHDVNGDQSTKDVDNGGIYYSIKSTDANKAIRFKDTLIEGCHIKDVTRTGISMGSSKWCAASIGEDLSKHEIEKLKNDYMHLDVVIKNNYVERSGGDGIVPMFSYEPLIEYNVVQEASINTKYGNPENIYSAGVFPWLCYKPLFQYNEVFDTYLNGDGQSYDCDWSWGTIYQYNYSHDNAGGFMLACQTYPIDSVVRYNISQNDRRSIFMTSNKPDLYVYNNTIYIGKNLNTAIFAPYNGPTKFYNNIFYKEGTPKSEDWHQQFSQYDSNLFYGYTNTPNDPNKVVENPYFKDPGKGGVGSLATGPNFASLHGYELQENSPAIKAGKYVEKNRLPNIIDPITKDIFNHEIGNVRVDLGAIESGKNMPTPEKEDIYACYEQYSTIKQGPIWFYEYREDGIVTPLQQVQGQQPYWKHPTPTNWAAVSKFPEENKVSISSSPASEGLITFIAPEDGDVVISDVVALHFPIIDGTVNYRVEKNGEKIWPNNSEWVGLKGQNKVSVTDLNVNVKEGDRISFVAKYAGHNRPEILNEPAIRYQNQVVH